MFLPLLLSLNLLSAPMTLPQVSLDTVQAQTAEAVSFEDTVTLKDLDKDTDYRLHVLLLASTDDGKTWGEITLPTGQVVEDYVPVEEDGDLPITIQLPKEAVDSLDGARLQFFYELLEVSDEKHLVGDRYVDL